MTIFARACITFGSQLYYPPQLKLYIFGFVLKGRTGDYEDVKVKSIRSLLGRQIPSDAHQSIDQGNDDTGYATPILEGDSGYLIPNEQENYLQHKTSSEVGIYEDVVASSEDLGYTELNPVDNTTEDGAYQKLLKQDSDDYVIPAHDEYVIPPTK